MFPVKKQAAWRDHIKSGAPAPGATHTPPQDQKGMDSNAAPPNTRRGMPISKPSSGRSVSMPDHSYVAEHDEAPPAVSGEKVGMTRVGAGVSQPSEPEFAENTVEDANVNEEDDSLTLIGRMLQEFLQQLPIMPDGSTPSLNVSISLGKPMDDSLVIEV